jgi:hypothetical protein
MSIKPDLAQNVPFIHFLFVAIVTCDWLVQK